MKRKYLIFTIFVCTLFFGFVGSVFAEDFGLSATAKVAYGGANYAKDLPTLIGNVVGAGLSMISVVFFGLMLWGGIRWMISRGNEDEAGKAKDTIIAAIIGIIIVMAAYALTTFVFSSIGAGGSGGGGGLPAGGGGEVVAETCEQRGGPGYACRNIVNCQDGTSIAGFCDGELQTCCLSVVQEETVWCLTDELLCEETTERLCTGDVQPSQAVCLSIIEQGWCFLDNTCEPSMRGGCVGEFFLDEDDCDAEIEVPIF